MRFLPLDHTAMPGSTRPSRNHVPTLVAGLLLAASLDAIAGGPLPALGGPGGGAFESRCPGNTVLVGLALRVGDVVDALHPVCAPPPGITGTAASMPWQGGPGGGPTQVLCPPDQPMATGLFVHSGGEETRVVDNLLLYCGRGNGARSSAYARPGAAGNFAATQDDTQGCAPGEVAVGVHGRSGVWVDAVGLLCGPSGVALAAAPDPSAIVKSIGRIGTGRSTSPPRPICDAARDARARKSPAADRLEAQCRATLSAQSPTVVVAPAPGTVSATRDATRLNPQPLPPKELERVPAMRTPEKIPPPKQPATTPAD